jgi:CNT family concentrative nucleoside transporter
MPQLISFFGLLTMLALAWLCSENRRRMNWRLIGSGLVLQFGLAVLLLATPARQGVFNFVAAVMSAFIACSDEGAKFVFGDGFREHYFVFSVMPTVIVFASFTAVLFHVGVLQWVVKMMARAMVWVMDTSGSESLCTAGNVFVGFTTAPLMIRPYLNSMTRSEIMAMMTGGMATVAGGPMVAYVGMAGDDATKLELAGHLAVASLISAPAALVISKIMVPETEESVTKGTVKIDVPRTDANLIDAACRGAGEGLKLVLNIVAMLIAFLALIHLVNLLLAGMSYSVNSAVAKLAGADGDPWTVEGLLGGHELTVQLLLSWLGAPLAWLMGVPWKDAPSVGLLLSEKTVFNEFIAYQHLLGDIKETISPRSFTIATYALCGFANFGSIAVMIGGIGGLVPERRSDLARFGLRSLVGGTLAAFTTAAIAGMLID